MCQKRRNNPNSCNRQQQQGEQPQRPGDHRPRFSVPTLNRDISPSSCACACAYPIPIGPSPTASRCPCASFQFPCPLALLAKPSYLATNRMKCRARQPAYQRTGTLPPRPIPNPARPLTACKSLPRCPHHCVAFVSDIWDTFTKTFYVFSGKSFAKDVLPAGRTVCRRRFAVIYRQLPLYQRPSSALYLAKN